MGQGWGACHYFIPRAIGNHSSVLHRGVMIRATWGRCHAEWPCGWGRQEYISRLMELSRQQFSKDGGLNQKVVVEVVRSGQAGRVKIGA